MSNKKDFNVALVGQGFMGRTHSNAWSQVGKFFPSSRKVVMHSTHGVETELMEDFASNWGWEKSVNASGGLEFDPEVELVDIVTPNFLHAEGAITALKAGKCVSCEKPISATLDQAREMAKLAKAKNAKTFVWYNYRRCPAVGLAHKLVKSGALGEITRVSAWYLQDWADASIPLTWRFKKKLAGGGAIGDLAAHIVDATRFVSGMEITDICGAAMGTFIKERAAEVGATTGQIHISGKKGSKMGKVNVDDSTLFIARFGNGALGSFEVCRQATGNQNQNGFEINGSKGAVRFNFERMNELEYYDATSTRATQGWTNILCTHAGDHEYVGNWWPDAHPIGYEHTFINMASDIIKVMSGKEPALPIPDFEDAYQTQRVLAAAELAATEKQWVKMSTVK